MSKPTEIHFVRQKHDAKRAGLHYDYRVVIGDKAFSWASRKEFPEVGKPTILWHQPVHHAAYLNNPDITIPEGQYGAGTQVIDYAQKGHAVVQHDAYHLELNNGDRFLIKKAPDSYGEKAWLFLRKKKLEDKKNPYLEKVAAVQENKRTKKTAVGEVAVGAYGLNHVSKAPSKLLGYHNMYHGTSKENAKSILKDGLNKSKGGSRGAKVTIGGEEALNGFVGAAKKHVYMTKSKFIGRTFAGDSAKHINTHGVASIKATTETLKDGFKNGKVLKARVPHSTWEKSFKMDPDSFPEHIRWVTPEEKLKPIAARSKHNVGSQFFVGGKGDRGVKGFATKNNLRRYYSSASGKARGKLGAVQLASGAALAAGAAWHNKSTGGVLSKGK